MKIFRYFFCFLLTISYQSIHYEKFFEIQGGPEYMYYFTRFQVGNPQIEETAIIDTGSDTLAFPCEQCQGRLCGSHQDQRFISKNSKTFSYNISCTNRFMYQYKDVCRFQKTYAEGSQLMGFLGVDYIKFKNSQPVRDKKLDKFNKFLLKDLSLKAIFGCTIKETGLFQNQYADGILGLDDGSTFIKSLEQDHILKGEKVFSFGLCFHQSGGIMSIDLRHKYHRDDKITMLQKGISDYGEHITIPYITENNYYEIKLKRLELDGKFFNEERVSIMIDSGTTFSHFPKHYLMNIMKELRAYCERNLHQCGRLQNLDFSKQSCIELKQPDKYYKNSEQLLESFPDFKIFFEGNSKPYIMRPRNYFYKEFLDDFEKKQKLSRICFALKENTEGKVILGAFSMIDNYFYFDRKEKVLRIFKEDCNLRTNQIMKMRLRILEAVKIHVKTHGKNFLKKTFIFGTFLTIFSLVYMMIKKDLKKQFNQQKQFTFNFFLF